MKKLFTILTLLFLSATPVLAKENTQVTKILPAGEVVQGDYFVAGENVEISGTVQGDVYAAGQRVLVNGIINGDLIVTGAMVEIGGRVQEDVRAAGGQVRISGTVGKDASIFAGSFELTKDGSIQDGLMVASGETIISGKIQNYAQVATGQLIVSQDAKITGDINYWSDQDASVSPSASISGSISQQSGDVDISPEKVLAPLQGVVGGFFKVASLLATLVIGFLILWLRPSYVKSVDAILKDKFWASMGVGTLIFIGFPIILALIAATLLGIPLAILLGILWFIALYIGRVFVFVTLGEKTAKAFKQKVSPTWAFLTGLVVYYLLSWIPVIGDITKFVVLLAGIGAMYLYERKRRSL